MYHVYYCVIRTSVKILIHFEIQRTVRLMQKDRCMYRLLVGWLNHMSLTSLQPCRTVLFGALSCLLGLLEAVQKDPVSAMAE